MKNEDDNKEQRNRDLKYIVLVVLLIVFFLSCLVLFTPTIPVKFEHYDSNIDNMTTICGYITFYDKLTSQNCFEIHQKSMNMNTSYYCAISGYDSMLYYQSDSIFVRLIDKIL